MLKEYNKHNVIEGHYAYYMPHWDQASLVSVRKDELSFALVIEFQSGYFATDISAIPESARLIPIGSSGHFEYKR